MGSAEAERSPSAQSLSKNTQLTLLVEGNTNNRSVSSSDSQNGSQEGDSQCDGSERYRSEDNCSSRSGRTDRAADDKRSNSSVDGSSSDPTDRRSDND